MFRCNSHFLIFCCVLLAGCGYSVEEQVERLAGSQEEREQARQELLLAKERAVEPLLEALGDPRHDRARVELVDVLVSLGSRVEDARIAAALNQLLISDGDPEVRERVALRMGLFKRAEAIPALLEALDDEAGEVRYQAVLALGELEAKLDEEQTEEMSRRVQEMAADEHAGVREEALVRIEDFVNDWLVEARQVALKAQLAQAESLYHQALAYFPHSKHATYQLGRFYFDNGDEEKGVEELRRGGMLLEVPRLPRTPKIDGRLDDPAWQQAAHADSFAKFSWGNYAAPPAEVQSTFFIGYTPDALYIGFRGHDDHPDSLVARITESDPRRDGDLARERGPRNQIWSDDIIELMFDANLDRVSFAHFGINSLGLWEDEWSAGRSGMMGTYDPEARWGFAGDVDIAARVGEDYWSVEFQLNFGQEQFPPPKPGTIWGFNLVRNFRGEQYLQWVRTYGSGLQPDQFGMLVFR